MTATLSFFVAGTPRPQGSKRGFKTKKGGVVLVEMSGDNLKVWRNRVAAVAQEHRPAALIDGPVYVTVDFVFPRACTHYGKRKGARYLKTDAPTWVCKTPDLSKLVRALEDELSGVLLTDDARIVRISASKAYGDVPGAHVTLTALQNSLAGVERSA